MLARLFLVATMFSASTAWATSAGTLFSQAPDTSLGGSVSQVVDGVPGAQIADDFVLGADSLLTDVHWYGAFQNSMVVSSWNVKIRLFADASGLPAATPFYDHDLVASVTDTTLTLPNGPNLLPLLAFWVDPVPSVELLGGTTYWISILPDAPESSQFLWAINGTSSDRRAFRGPASDWAPTGLNMAFELTGVPEPSLGLQLASCALVLGWSRCRRVRWIAEWMAASSGHRGPRTPRHDRSTGDLGLRRPWAASRATRSW